MAGPLLVLALAMTGCSDPDEQVAQEAVAVGVSLPSYHYDVSAVRDWEAAVGQRADVVQTFVSWEYDDEPGLNDFPADEAREISKGGRTLEVSWVPSNPDDGRDQKDFSLDSIAGGAHDDYVRSFAEEVRDSGLHVRLRLGHEMNGNWQAFNESNSGNDAGDFARAWRHVHDLFSDVGATDVEWVWSPNIVGPDLTPLAGLYPGDAFVDVVGIDGYSYPKSGCPSPSLLFDETLREVRAITQRPVGLAEVGVERRCPDRAAWVTDLFGWAEEHGVREITWWERAGDRDDFRLAGDNAPLEAYRAAVDR